MIDWLNFTIEVQHPTIAHGRWFVLDEFGEVLRESDTFRNVEGSYDSTMQVCSTSAMDFYSDAMLELGLWKGNDSKGQSSAISFFGNPVKYLQGHNVIGTNCIRGLVIELITDIFPKIGLPDSAFFDAILKVQSLDFWVTRIDITQMYDLGTSKDVDDYIYMLPLTVKARGDRCDYTKSTFYVGKHSTLWSLKIYNKYKELLSRSKHHRLNPAFDETGLLDFAKGKLRSEVTLRKKQIDRLKMSHASKLQGELDNLYNDFLGRLTMTNQRENHAMIAGLSPRYQATYYRWKEGGNPRSFLTKATFYNHKRELLKCGIDISNPPIPVGERVAEIEPLQKVLAPRIIRFSDIPRDLMPHLVQPYKSGNLRIA